MSLPQIELERKKLYEGIIYWIKDEIKLNLKEVNHLLLRYIFNKIVYRTKTDDPIFITTYSPASKEQLTKDFVYFNLKNNPTIFIQKLEEKLVSSSLLIKNIKLENHEEPRLLNGKIIFQNIIYETGESLKETVDFKNSQSKSLYLSHIVALNIRYKYMGLTTHGLARDYSKLSSSDKGIEAFSSVFNKYFDSFCSAFPDLESIFGSRGSFFDLDLSKETKTIYINPPFDEAIMINIFIKIDEYKNSSLKNSLKFVCTFPRWKDFSQLNKFIKKDYVKKVTFYKKGELPFIDYQKNKLIYPCDIVELII